MSTPALVVDGLTVAFGDFVAVDGLSFVAEYGTVHGLIGPNGAGKTTLLDVVSGVTRPRAGRVLLDGRSELTRLDQPGIARAGVGRKFQKPSVFEALTVAENLELAVPDGEPEAVRRMLTLIELEPLADRPAGTLAHGQKQWLEIGMVLAREPRLVLLDEPVAGLSDEETARTAALVRSLRGPERAILVVEHDMDFVEAVADRVTVLHEGRTLFEGAMQAAREDARVVEVYLGRAR